MADMSGLISIFRKLVPEKRAVREELKSEGEEMLDYEALKMSKYSWQSNLQG